MKTDRASAIRQHLFAHGHSSIAEIARAVGASEPTVRRDLMALEAEGLVTRSHGGAQIATASGIEVAFEAREQVSAAPKRAIAARAHGLLHPGMAVFLDAGTTVLQLARQLRLSPLPLQVFTNCLPVAQVLMPVPGVAVTLLGGTLRPENASLVGMLAEEALERLWFDLLILGAGAVSEGGEISSADEQEARLNRAMLRRSGTRVLLADADKFGRRLTWGVGQIGPGMRVISDARLAASFRAGLTDLGADLVLA